MSQLTNKDIQRLFTLLNGELKKNSSQGEVYMVGGAVMCLVFNARPSTKDIDAFFKPTTEMRKAITKVAKKTSLNEDWLNDAAKGFFSSKGNFNDFIELSNLKIFIPIPEYLFAMKCLAMRIGEEFHDMDDIYYLIRYLNLKNYNSAIKIITHYYPKKQFPQKTLYALQEIFDKKKKSK